MDRGYKAVRQARHDPGPGDDILGRVSGRMPNDAKRPVLELEARSDPLQTPKRPWTFVVALALPGQANIRVGRPRREPRQAYKLVCGSTSASRFGAPT